MLKFSFSNSKLAKGIATFSLPSGWSCPFAGDCLSKANRETGKVTDGKDCKFRCFSASQEAVYKNVRLARWHNFDLLKGKTVEGMVNLIQEALPMVRMVRIHVGGDFFSQNYFDAWLAVANRNPNTIFYAYTKSVKYWIARRAVIPSNFILTASRGTKDDALIDKYNLRCAEVVFSEQEAIDKGLEIDHDDSHAYTNGPSFALLIHGTQPAGSEAGKAKAKLKGKGSYGKGAK